MPLSTWKANAWKEGVHGEEREEGSQIRGHDVRPLAVAREGWKGEREFEAGRQTDGLDKRDTFSILRAQKRPQNP